MTTPSAFLGQEGRFLGLGVYLGGCLLQEQHGSAEPVKATALPGCPAPVLLCGEEALVFPFF